MSDPKLAYLSLSDEELYQLHKTGEYPIEDTSLYTGLAEDDKLVAILKWEWFSSVALNMHLYLRSELHHTGLLGRIYAFLYGHFKENTNIQKLLFMVPESCEHVHGAAKKYNLVQEGRIKKCCKWRNELNDVLIYSIDIDRTE